MTATTGNRRSEIVLVASNSSWNLVNFRAPLLRAFLDSGYRVVASAPLDEFTDELRSMGVEVEPITVDASGLSPLKDSALLIAYIRQMRRLAPAAFLGFTAKPNIYGSLAARACGVPGINTITGLGTGFLSGRGLERLVSALYRTALRRSRRVFFHNEDDLELFVGRKLITANQGAVVAGSGINLERFAPAAGSAKAGPPNFLFIGRFLRDKGVAEFINAAALVKKQTLARFQMVGAVEDHPKAVSRELVESAVSDGIIELLGTTSDVRAFIAGADCVVLPSYREGLPRVILEASAMAKPVITTDVPGCRQAVDDGVTGLLCDARSATALAQAMLGFAGMASEERSEMGSAGRAKAEREFSDQSVASTYLEALAAIAGRTR